MQNGVPFNFAFCWQMIQISHPMAVPTDLREIWVLSQLTFWHWFSFCCFTEKFPGRPGAEGKAPVLPPWSCELSPHFGELGTLVW